MITRHRRRSPFRLLWLPLTTAAFVGYFGYHAYNGSYGVPALEQMQVEARDLKASLEDLRDERAALEKRVSYLKPDSLAHSSDFTVLTLVKNHFKNYSALLLVNYTDICRSGFSAVKLNACFKLYKLILVN